MFGGQLILSSRQLRSTLILWYFPSCVQAAMMAEIGANYRRLGELLSAIRWNNFAGQPG